MSQTPETTPEQQEPTSYSYEEVQEMYQGFVNYFFSDIKQRSMDCLEWGEQHKMWQNLDDNTGCPENVLGWMYCLSSLQKLSADGQCRWEMVGQCEETQFAVQLISGISDVANQINRLSEDLLMMWAHYRTILQGRRTFNISYTDQDGNFVSCDDFEYGQSSAVRKYDAERRRREEEIRRATPLTYCEYVDEASGILKELFSQPLVPVTTSDQE